ncbi:hypothetical protein Mapa_002262 [Marchantia paleacea]|nr:hypothetical protein Mapa_002262 [Marchantia paleacea]
MMPTMVQTNIGLLSPRGRLPYPPATNAPRANNKQLTKGMRVCASRMAKYAEKVLGPTRVSVMRMVRIVVPRQQRMVYRARKKDRQSRIQKHLKAFQLYCPTPSVPKGGCNKALKVMPANNVAVTNTALIECCEAFFSSLKAFFRFALDGCSTSISRTSLRPLDFSRVCRCHASFHGTHRSSLYTVELNFE